MASNPSNTLTTNSKNIQQLNSYIYKNNVMKELAGKKDINLEGYKKAR